MICFQHTAPVHSTIVYTICTCLKVKDIIDFEKE
jgi:hypothetical protein